MLFPLMNKLRSFAALSIAWLLLTLSTSASALIVERPSFRGLSRDIDKNTILVLDIDNTILENQQTLGTDQWLRWMPSYYIEKGMTEEAARAQALKDWFLVADHSHVRPVESGTPKMILQFQKARIPLLVLTSRSYPTIAATERQMKELKIDFRNSTLSAQMDFEIEPGLRYRNGILYSSGQDKGSSFLKLMKALQMRPRKVVFADDHEKHVKSMEAALTAARVPVLNIRYSAADPRVKSFNAKIARVQWDYFQKYKRIISDRQALEILQRPHR